MTRIQNGEFFESTFLFWNTCGLFLFDSNKKCKKIICHCWKPCCKLDKGCSWIPSSFSRGKRVLNQKCSKLVENYPINQFYHEKSIRNGFRIIRLLFIDPINQFWHEMSIGNGFRRIGLLFLAHRFPWWKSVRKSQMLRVGQKSSNKLILTWEIDWKWFQNDPNVVIWSDAFWSPSWRLILRLF